MSIVTEAPESTVMIRYEITVNEIKNMVSVASAITVAGANDSAGMSLARQHRLGLQRVRTRIESKRKELKADALAYGRKVDEVAKELTALIVPEETRLKDLEETAKREQERLEALERQKREAESQRRCGLLNAIGVSYPVFEIESMEPATFDAFYAEQKSAFDEKQKAEAEAAAAQKAEQERLMAIAKEQAEKQAAIDRQNVELEAKQKAVEDAEQEVKMKLLSSRVSALFAIGQSMDAEPILAMTSKEFDQYLAGATEAFQQRKTSEAKEEAERIAKAAKDEANQIERERLAEITRQKAAVEAAEAERIRLAAMAPDREKIAAYAEAIRSIPLPQLSADCRKQQNRIEETRNSLLVRLNQIADEIGRTST